MFYDSAITLVGGQVVFKGSQAKILFKVKHASRCASANLEMIVKKKKAAAT
jgi:hypothetical protein